MLFNVGVAERAEVNDFAVARNQRHDARQVAVIDLCRVELVDVREALGRKALVLGPRGRQALRDYVHGRQHQSNDHEMCPHDSCHPRSSVVFLHGHRLDCSVCFVGVHGFLLFLENVPHGSGEDHGLHVLGNAASVQHLVIALLTCVELPQFALEDVGADKLFKGIAGSGRGVCGLTTPLHQKIERKNS